MSQERLEFLGLRTVFAIRRRRGGFKSPRADTNWAGWNVGSVDPARATTARATGVRGDENEESGNDR
jgi:hypothetical protein